MFRAKLIALLLSLRAMLIPCCPGEGNPLNYQLSRYARMPATLAESSGLELGPAGTFWTILDSGSPAALYRISAAGQLLDSLLLPLTNRDWEDLARDDKGNLYIADIGNNLNLRRDLLIYKFNPELGQLDTIHFYWPEQKTFPPPAKERNFDSEALFWYQDQLHLFTKSYGDGILRHYSLPDNAGSYPAKLLESVPLRGLVTAADISPSGSTLALLTYGKVYLFAVQAPEQMLSTAVSCVRIPWLGQGESLLFINNSTLLLGNETGRLFYLQLAP